MNDNFPAPLSIRGVKLSDGQAVRFSDAQAKIASKDLATQRLGHLALEALDRELDRLVGSNEVKARFAEVEDLEAERESRIDDVTVIAPDKTSAKTKRISRDGLETLAQEKTDKATNEPIPPAIDHIQYTAGQRFRVDYERIDPERKLTPPTLMREGKSRGGGSEGYDRKVAESWDRVRTIYLMIAGVSFELSQRQQDEFAGPTMPRLPAGHPAMRAIHALNEIAGKGMNLGDMTNSGSVKERIREDLIFALDACAIVYGLE
jgi:hypothetical protein